MTGRPWLDGRRQHAESTVCVIEGPGLAGGQLPHALAGPVRVNYDLVVDVGDILNEGHIKPGRGEPAAQDVERDRGTHMPDMWRGLDGGPTDVHAHMTGAQRLEGPRAPGARVVDVESHLSSVRCGPRSHAHAPRQQLRSVPRTTHKSDGEYSGQIELRRCSTGQHRPAPASTGQHRPAPASTGQHRPDRR